MEIIQRMNQRLDSGWKITNSNCEKCNGVTMADPNNLTQYYCPKCDKLFPFQAQDQDQYALKEPSPKDSSNDEDFFNNVIAESGLFPKKQTPKPSQLKTTKQQDQNYNNYSYEIKEQKTNDVSKKLGEKLLQGWAMLQQCCLDCNVPLMKSRKGQKICFSCDKDYAQVQAEKKNKPLANKLQQQQKSTPQKLQSQPIQYTKSPLPTIEQSKPATQTITTNISGNAAVTDRLNSLVKKSSSSRDDLIDSIECKAFRFLEFKMDKAIEQNDIGAVERILAILKTMKN